MTWRLSGCSRFKALLNESEDRTLNRREESFMAQHRSACEECRREETSQYLSLNMLRAATIEATPPAQFDDRVIRLVHVQSVKDSLSYWSPAFVGCALACVALFAALHVLTLEPPTSSVKISNGTAMRGQDAFPDLSLKHLPPFVR